MNILITNDDGPLAIGLCVLRCAVRRVFPRARLVVLTPRNGEGGKSLSVTTSGKKVDVEGSGLEHFVGDATPADLIYLALGSADLFLDEGEQFDLVLAGVNHGENVGMDIFHSGTVGMAMLASGLFQVPAVAFSQQIPYPVASQDESLFCTSLEWLHQVLSNQILEEGMCWNINFPSSPARGLKLCRASMYSRFRPTIQPKNKAPGGDVYELEQGYVTCVQLRPAAISCHNRFGQATAHFLDAN